jgi:NitT/TauT family transport system permease protein
MKQVSAYDAEVQPAARDEGIVEDVVAARRRAERWKLIGLRFAGIIAIIAIWQIVSGTLVDPFWVSRPSDILARLQRWTSPPNYTLFTNLGVTFLEMVVGFVGGSIAGIALGLLLGLNRFISKLLDPFLIGFYSVPRIALAPLFILWFGIGLAPKMILAGVVVFFLVFMNTFAGVRDVDRELIDVVRVMGARRDQILRLVVLPSALAWVFAGLKMSVPYALIGAVVAELVAAKAGIGFLLSLASGQFDTTGVFTALIVLTLVGVLINELVNRAEGFLLRWRVVNR